MGSPIGLWGLVVIAAAGAVSPEAPDTASAVPLREVVTCRAMGTEFTFILYTRPGDKSTSGIRMIADEAFEKIQDLDARLSRWRPDSQTTYVNNHAAAGPVKVAPDILDLILFSKRIHTESDGAFDITVGPLIALWGFYRGEGQLPGEQARQEALSKIGLDKVVVDREAGTIAYKREGVLIDFGGIGKGVALDYAAEVFRNHGVTSAVLHGGTSTVVAMGAPPGEPGWTVRIRHPYNTDEYIGEIVLRDESLSTSAGYEKFFVLEGKKYVHIFDPKTGKPVEGMLSASAVAPTGTLTDALSTAFFVLGEEKTRAYCREHPEVRAVLVSVPECGEPRPLWINFAAKQGAMSSHER